MPGALLRSMLLPPCSDHWNLPSPTREEHGGRCGDDSTRRELWQQRLACVARELRNLMIARAAGELQTSSSAHFGVGFWGH